MGLCIAAAAAAAIVYDKSNFSAAGRVYQPVPERYIIGKDNGPGVGLHHAGERCDNCHKKGGAAEAYLWTASGTLYADRAGRKVLPGGEIILQDREGKVISMTANAAGNFWTNTSIASNPFAVASHGGMTEPLYVLDADGNLVEPADPADPRTWIYKAWVRHGAAVRPMVTLAPVGSATGNYMSCNMHHNPKGSRGALWVSSEPALPSYPARGLKYTEHIHPILNGKCVPCHIPGKTMTRLVTKSDIDTPSTAIDYSHSLDLINYRGSETGGYLKLGIRSVVNTADPGKSLLLNKTVPGALHGGGAFWDQSSPDYLALQQWISEGARNDLYSSSQRSIILLLLSD
jgi:hypothetical protein